jgi:hypothetical protein
MDHRERRGGHNDYGDRERNDSRGNFFRKNKNFLPALNYHE